MRDVEELLRDTLTDPRRRVEPAGGMYETVSRRAHTIRRNRWAFASATTAVVAVIASAATIVTSSPGHRAQPGQQNSSTAIGTTPGQPSTAPHGAVGSAVNVGDGWPSDAVSTAGGLYVLTNNPSQIVKLDTAGSRVLATAPAPSQYGGVTVGDGRVWVWTQTPGELHVFDADTLAPLGVYTTGTDLFEVAEVDGYVYLTSGHGLLRASVAALPGQPTATHPGGAPLAASKVADVEGGTYGIAADPARHRVLVGVMPIGSAPTNGFAGVRVVAIDARTGKVLAQSPQTSVGKESIAVVGDQVWVGGYGDTDKSRLLHLNAATLKVVGTSPVGDSVGPGAILWPGEKVLWVRNGGDTTLSCVDPKTGAVLEQWLAVQGPVVSTTGHAFGIQAGLQPLVLNGACAG
jgi:glutamine cyclotransferase